MQLGQLIKQERERHGISQAELARRADVSQSLVAKMEQGERGTRIDTLVRVTDVLGISADAVFDFVRQENSPNESTAPIGIVSDLIRRIEALERRDGEPNVRRRFSSPSAGVLQPAS